MSEHTPTPWHVEQGTDLIWGACNPDDISSDGMGYSIVQGRSSSWGERKPDMAEREANAAFIVKCVNSHDALVKALENVRRIISEGAMTGFNYKDGDWAERLFESQQSTCAALASIKETV